MDPTRLKPANQKPWYILMTLHGEQEEEEVSDELHRKNARYWNAWALSKFRNAKEKVDFGKEHKLTSVDGTSSLPSASEVERLFKEEWLKRGGDPDDVPDLPDPHADIELSSVMFDHIVAAKGLYFPAYTVFSGSYFADLAEFDRAVFADDIWLESAQFDEGLSANRARFKRFIVCPDTTFDERVDFGHAVFERAVNFGHSTFRRSVDFIWAEFGDTVDFQYTTFSEYGVFQNAHFKDRVTFARAEFTNNGAGNLLLQEARLDEPASFHDTQFRHSYPHLSGTILHPLTEWSANKIFWPMPGRQGPNNSMEFQIREFRETCARIRHNLAQQGLIEEQQFFHRREMYFAGRSGPILGRVPYWIYEVFSDFGYSIQRPVMWLFLTWLVPIWFYLGVDLDPDQGFQAAGQATAAAFSFASIFKFFGFQSTYFGTISDLPDHLQLLSAGQTVFGFLMLFFLGLGLRSRFRLR